MGPRFDDFIAFSGDQVVAIGPLDERDFIEEVCAWVYQPTSNLLQDAAATEMTTNRTLASLHFQQIQGRWLLNLERIPSSASFRRGEKAFAVAVTLLSEVIDLAQDREDASNRRNPRVVWWGQPVRLFEDATVAALAVQADALTSSPLAAQGPYASSNSTPQSA